MRPTAVESCFEIAFWFLDRALNDGEYLQPPKLQRLMYLAQAYFAVVQNGAKLMPATFVAHDMFHVLCDYRPYGMDEIAVEEVTIAHEGLERA